MKILFATMQFGKEYGFGTERYLSSLAAELRQGGDDVFFLSGDPDHRYAPVTRFHLAEHDPFPVYVTPTRGILTIAGQPVESYLDFLREHQPDLIHLANPAHIGLNLAHAAFRLHVPLVATIMDYWWLCPKHILLTNTQQLCDAKVTWNDCAACLFPLPQWRGVRFLRKFPGIRSLFNLGLVHSIGAKQGFSPQEIHHWIRRRHSAISVLDQCKAIIFPSKTSQIQMMPYLSNLVIRHIPYGVDPLFLTTPIPQTKPIHRSHETLKVGFAGSLAEHKGPHLLVEAFHRLGWDKTELKMTGGDSPSPYVRRLRGQSSGLNVQFLGSCSVEQMLSFYDQLDLLVIPSLWPENTPFVLLEAMARRVPVLGSNVPGIAEVLKDSRFRFDFNSPDSLAKKMEACIPILGDFRFPTISTIAEMAHQTKALYTAPCI